MRRGLVFLVSLSVVPTASLRAASGVSFHYSIEREREGNVVESNFLRGFDMREGLRLRVKVDQVSYCYVIMGEAGGQFRLAFPDPELRRSEALPENQWARLPKSTFVRVGDDPGIERMYLVIALERIPELEAAFAKGSSRISEAVAIDVRDRYHAEGSYSRDLDGPTTSVKYKPKGSAPAVVVEEISLRARQ